MDGSSAAGSGSLPGGRRLLIDEAAGREMGGLGQVLAQAGWDVRRARPGRAVAPPDRRGLRVDAGHDPAGAPVLVYGPGVARTDPSRLSMARRASKARSRGSILAGLSRGRTALVLTGGRHAGRAAAMIGWTLTLAGHDPTVVLAEAAAPQLGGAGRLGEGDHCVFESAGDPDEMAEVRPGLAVALGTIGAADDPRGLFESVPSGGLLLGRAGDPGFAVASRGLPAGAETLALDRGATWWGADLREDAGRFRFRAFCRGRFVAEVRLRVRGLAYVEPALAAVAACHRLDLPNAAIKDGLEEFTGLSRGFESRGSYRGVTLWDDDARDPGAVAEAVGLARRLSGRRRIWAVTDRGALGQDPEAAARGLVEADELIVVAGADDAGPPGLDLALEGRGRPPARRAADPAEAVSILDRSLEPGDVLLTLGAGDVGTIADALSGRLPRDRQDD